METAITEIVEHASQQDDRWLFIALLVIGMFAIAWLVRYFQSQQKTQEAKISHLETMVYELSQEFRDHLKTWNHDQSLVIGECHTTIAQNAAIIAQAKEAAARYSQIMERIEKKLS